MNRQDAAADRLERLLRRDLEEAAREAGPPSAEQIDAYVAGRASAAEREVIESWLADDPALRSEVDALMSMRQTLEAEVTLKVESESRQAASTPREASSRTHIPAPPRAPAPLRETGRQMRTRPMRTAALLALAASLAFFILWIASPGRPPVDSEVATGAPGRPSSVPAPDNSPAGTGTTPVATLTLRDAGREVSLLASGEIRGLDGLEASNRSAVARALASGRLEMTEQVDALAGSASTLRSSGDAGTALALRVITPVATAVRTARPAFEWTAVPGATAYRVRIADASLDPVMESPMLTTTTWTPASALPSGRVLMWQVEAQTPQGLVVAPAPPAAEARILVLRDTDAQTLARALEAANGSDLAAAVTLARFGVLDEADAALARLATANRDVDAIARLRRQLSDRRFPR
jgi:anti-sigma factor RsiW